ncbi:ankyrin repeat-containing domain protein [Suillus paluster]|uniref:ankyrin repeat-containing domain protein n=1 Tax=Suillus paluster TaxID=48578 RepID=UPI001B88513C|nr:ankyrin repeat-containing domain protein [Suillus paluster]KAG1750547.1 ankyrin repeat-containing domain protein [Suillus paluster]
MIDHNTQAAGHSDGGLKVTAEMEVILNQPDHIGIKMGSEKLRSMFQTQFGELDINKLSPFALACMTGQIQVVETAISGGSAPDITGTETPFKIGFLSFTVLGAQRIRGGPPSSLRYLDVIKYLLQCGAPPDLPDISGHTALHHACTPPLGHFELARALLEGGANPNVQNRYGEVPLFFPFQGQDIPILDLLMEHNADLDIKDGNGDSPRALCVVFGPQVTAAVRRWERKRSGEKALLEEKECEYCKKKGSGLKQCGRCHTVRYCSSDCQRMHWKTHKPLCQPFSTSTTVTLKPTYGDFSSAISRADFTRERLGLSSRKSKPPKNTPISFDQKSMIIKVQVPVDPFSPIATSMGLGGLLIYNKKKDFMCTIQRAGNENAYDEIVRMVKSRGVGGVKAYFAAELRTRDELVVKISEPLAEQPF